jgi:integrase
MPDFVVALRKRSGDAANALLWLILTTSRTSEALLATWVEINREQGLWTIPAERTKARKEHVVPLSAAALAIIERLPYEEGLLFRAPPTKRSPGAVRPLSTNALLALIKRLHEEHPWTDRDGRRITVHGFRSTFRDWAAEQTDYPREVAEMALAHVVRGVEGAYRRGDLFNKRIKLMADWAAFCASEPPRVLQLKMTK